MRQTFRRLAFWGVLLAIVCAGVPGFAQQNCQSLNDVTVAWDVMPWHLVKDNFGHYIANQFIGLDVAVVNRTNDTLIVNAFQFCPNQMTTVRLTTASPMVRGAIDKGQSVGMRNTTVNIIKSVGLIGVGFEGFFKAAGSSATYNRGVSIFSGPFEKGVELVWPDTTIKYLKNWDADEIFKNGFVATKGQTIRGRVFIPILAIYPKSAKIKAKDLDPTKVKTDINALVIVGAKAAGEFTAIQ
jgi:hypothetical protein